MSRFNNKSPENLESDLPAKLFEIDTSYTLNFYKETHSLETNFSHIIKALAHTEKGVVLIDEYDKPIISQLHNPEILEANKQILQSFYGILKSMDEHLRFVFLTSVSKFSKGSVFSGLNNLRGLTHTRDYASLCGYTQSEIEHYFHQHIQSFATEQSISIPNCLQQIKTWYNGYRFSTAPEKVYNPFSRLLIFENKEFKNYWFDTATPSFLVKQIKNNDTPLESLQNKQLSESIFSSFDIDNLNIRALLLQTGYLTIYHYNPDTMLYDLDFPNKEVKQSFLNHLMEAFSYQKTETITSLSARLLQTLQTQNMADYTEIMNQLFEKIPYPIHIKQEKYCQSILFLINLIMGLNTHVEIYIHKGRIDAVI